MLPVALRNDIFVPHLCEAPGSLEPFAACRLCFVEVEGKAKPVTACTEPVREGIRVRTDSPMVRRLQRSALRLLLSAHHIDCRNCHANRRCKLQEIGRALRVRLRVTGLRDLSTRDPLDRTLSDLAYDRNRCVLCGRCVALSLQRGDGLFRFAHRGLETRIAIFPPPGGQEPLGTCAQECPVGALIPTLERPAGDPQQTCPRDT